MVTVEDDMMMYTTDYLLIMIHLKNKTNNESYELLGILEKWYFTTSVY